ncbi:MAG: hypothetical protein SFV54_18605 [Bryobacteraceae bacterium]|nr:hypothetical protein [Bryobacteraceae bacterium]
MQAFVVRPFSVKENIDFERVHNELIEPALKRAEIAGGTTGEILEAGNIREDMFQLLLLADLVVADISIHNANVFYELGIRHALRGRQTVLLRARVTIDVPFDLKTDRYISYDPQNPAAALPDLFDALQQTKSSNRIDSPVFRSLPKLREPEQSALSPVPLDFVGDVDLAASRRQGGKLGLLAQECGRFLWELGGLRVAGRCQYKGEFFRSALETWEKVRELYPQDLEANLILGTIYHRLGDLALSDQRLQCVLDLSSVEPRERAEALALRARNEKARGREAWAGKDTPARRRSVLRSEFFFKSRQLYADAFEHDLNHFYSGLNALSLSVLLVELISQEKDLWSENFDSDDAADQELRNLSRSRDRLVTTVESALLAAERRGQDLNWLPMSKADWRFLTAAKDATAVAAYERALAGADDFQKASAAAQLELFQDLGVRTQRVAACLAVFPPKPPASAELRHAILFTGHRIDEPGRTPPRFPASLEPAARADIRRQIERLITDRPGPAIGIAGGANGGDILFHEVCEELGIRTRVLLTLPEGPFIAASVDSPTGDWTRRFNHLMETHSGKNEVQVLGPTKELPIWMRNPAGYDVWQRTNTWILEEALSLAADDTTLIALWDGHIGDGPGGTKDLTDRARARGVNTILINTNTLG